MTRIFLVALGLAIAPGLALAAAGDACRAESGATAGVLVELYTSEGCSSCPPADRWFGQLASKSDPQTTSLLAFHVDYWNELGWTDRFSRHAFTVRQSQRVRAGGSSTIYTPQVMSSSGLGLHWYQPDAVSEALAQGRKQASRVQLKVSARPEAGQWRVALQAKPLVPSTGTPELYLALYEDDLVSQVRAGENNGVTLHHDRVVRGFWGPWPLSATGTTKELQVTLPGDARAAKSGLTAFVQDAKSGETLQALSLPLGRCGQ